MPAGADPPTQGSIVPYAAQCIPGFSSPSGPCSPGPFDSGQEISVNAPANSMFTSAHSIWIFECAAPNGVLPTSPTACDSQTVQEDGTIFPFSDGSIAFNAYIVYFLPDDIYLGEGPTHTPVCGDTAATECVLYIGQDVQASLVPTDFSQPHVFSQPFLVHADPGDVGTMNPGDGTPEVPVAVLLPVAAMGILGGVLLMGRRHSVRASR